MYNFIIVTCQKAEEAGEEDLPQHPPPIARPGFTQSLVSRPALDPPFPSVPTRAHRFVSILGAAWRRGPNGTDQRPARGMGGIQNRSGHHRREQVQLIRAPQKVPMVRDWWSWGWGSSTSSCSPLLGREIAAQDQRPRVQRSSFAPPHRDGTVAVHMHMPRHYPHASQ